MGWGEHINKGLQESKTGTTTAQQAAFCQYTIAYGVNFPGCKANVGCGMGRGALGWGDGTQRDVHYSPVAQKWGSVRAHPDPQCSPWLPESILTPQSLQRSTWNGQNGHGGELGDWGAFLSWERVGWALRNGAEMCPKASAQQTQRGNGSWYRNEQLEGET